EWQQHGLQAPDVVNQSTAKYRVESNPLKEWADECCSLDDRDAVTRGGELRDSFRRWNEHVGLKVSNQDWPRYLEALGCERIEHGNRASWRGIKLLDVG